MQARGAMGPRAHCGVGTGAAERREHLASHTQLREAEAAVVQADENVRRCKRVWDRTPGVL